MLKAVRRDDSGIERSKSSNGMYLWPLSKGRLLLGSGVDLLELQTHIHTSNGMVKCSIKP